jgi:transmembrane sensor
MHMFPNRFIELVSRQLSSSLSAEEERELNDLLKDPLLQVQYERMKKFWVQKEDAPLPNVDAALQKVLNTINAEEEVAPLPAKKKKPVWALASLLVVGASLAAFILLKNNTIVTGAPSAQNESAKPEIGWVDKQNSKGTRSVITLVDGSKVWLNADSRLQYPATFEGNTREVTLSGEAFFDVAKNKAKPFIIHLKNGTVRVLGTSFNIKAYDSDAYVETSVATGRVAFIPKKSGKADTTFLTHNRKAVYSLKTGMVKTISTLSQMDKAWTEGKLIFTNTSMDEIAATLERYFGKQVVINDEQLRSYRLTGSFENNSAEEILYYLSKTKPFTYRISESQIILSAVQ